MAEENEFLKKNNINIIINNERQGAKPTKTISVHPVSKRQTHLKKYNSLLITETKALGTHLYNSLSSLLKVSLYFFTVLGDVFLLWSKKKGKKSKKANKGSKKEKNFLNQGF